MLCKVIKPFHYAADGVTEKTMRAGSTQMIHDHLVDGLVAAGFLERPSQALEISAETQVPEIKEIPEDWRDLDWPAMRALAAEISEEPIRSKEDAITAIEAHLT